MTAPDIIRIITTVAIAQGCIDLLASRMVYKREPYQRAVSSFERAKTKRDKVLAQPTPASSNNATKSRSAAEKHLKKIQRAEDDYAEAAAEVAKRHSAPSFFGSIIFLILYRVLSTEYSGKIVAVLPFQPWKLVQRLSMRGLEIGQFVAEVEADGSYPAISSHTQACSFMFVYFLCTLSVKFIVNRILGTKPPHGADGGMGTMLDSPKNKKFMESLGVDTEELAEARKAF
uniref:Uncharacterized protein n=1 Tax=Ditylum brightwellii TaxID=49249 RepID=A0A7S4T7V7_9STRA|mmetsp:Transcript_47129/g.71266  ORF Transcript_47129/g.71266 Transcript_47129/m.71266 type:complete len:230 (+) Transcript_47129:114-803(+)